MLFCVKAPINKLYVFGMALLLAATLAGCGGGGGGTAQTPDPGTTPEMCPEGHTGTPPNCVSPEQQEANALAAAKTAAMTAYEAAKMALDAVMDDKSHDMDSYDKAKDALAEAKAANAVAQAAMTSAVAGDAQAVVETARNKVVMYAGMVTAAATKAAQRVVQEAANKVAKTKETAIAAEAAQTTDAGLGGSAVTATGNAEGAYNLAIKRDRMATTVTVTVEGATDAADEKFMQAMDLGGGRTMHTRTMEADDGGNVMEEVVVVSTDIEAPKATAFAMVTGQALNARDLDATADADGDGNAANDFTALTIVAGAGDVNLPKIMSPAFAPATGDTVTHTFDFDDAATTDEDEADERAGTYNGAMGTYRCDGGADCTVTLDGDGKVTAISAGWVFTPAAGATSDVPDSDYLHYGFWLKKTTDADGAITYNEIETFVGSSVAASGDTSTVQGKATYAGGAVGVYVHKTFKTDGTYDASSGHVKADVSLMATFGQVPVSGTDATGTIAPNLLNTVSGTIDNFMLSGGEEQMWSVALQGAITESAGTASGMAKGGVGDGSFSATFHGDVTAVDGVSPQPGSVVGEFNAEFTNGSAAGGFGARKQ